MITREEIFDFVKMKCANYKSEKLLPLMMPTFGPDEIMSAFDSMVDLNVTMGSKVSEFEQKFSSYLGIKHSTMLNSGSSANLLALSILSNPMVSNRIMFGDEIIVPSVTWSTSIFPIINVGARPVLADVDEDYVLDVEKLKELITPKTKAIMPVHLLGNVCDMKAINDIASDHKLFVVEDCCEALGSEYKSKKVGTYSDFSTFSFYFSHHITTIEGGMLCTNNFEYADLSRILRAHGYVRHSLKKEEFISQTPSIDPRFLFVNMGYNFRPMEIQGAFGIHQLPKLKTFLARRTEIANQLLVQLSKYSDLLILPKQKSGTRHSWFAFPITVKPNQKFTRSDLTNYLEDHGIETRPLVCGNFAEQPAMRLFNYRHGDLSYANLIMKSSFYIGIHSNIDDNTISAVVKVFDDFFSKVKT
ncbi:MAG: DegT/DnrJ/EryC1/StrS family aminotransferase [Candidatus Micrarchaeota archaeon]